MHAAMQFVRTRWYYHVKKQIFLFLDELDVKFFFTSNSFWRENLVKNKLIIEEMHDEL